MSECSHKNKKILQEFCLQIFLSGTFSFLTQIGPITTADPHAHAVRSFKSNILIQFLNLPGIMSQTQVQKRSHLSRMQSGDTLSSNMPAIPHCKKKTCNNCSSHHKWLLCCMLSYWKHSWVCLILCCDPKHNATQAHQELLNTASMSRWKAIMRSCSAVQRATYTALASSLRLMEVHTWIRSARWAFGTVTAVTGRHS